MAGGDDKIVRVTFEFDTTDADDKANSLIAKLNVLSKNSDDAASMLIKMSDATSRAEVSSGDLVDNLDAVSNSVKKTADNIEDMSEAVSAGAKKTTDGLDEISDAVTNVDANATILVDDINAVSEGASSSADAIGKMSEVNTTSLVENIDAVTESASSSADAIDKMSDSTSDLDKSAGATTNGVKNTANALSNATNGTKGFEIALKTITKVPVLLFLTAILAAIKSLFSWFNKTREGQLAFAKVSGYVSGVVDALGKVVLKVGEFLYKAFSNPKQAVKDLWNVIKENLVNRMEGVGEVFKAIGKIISSGFTTGYDDLKVAALKAATGVENLDQKVKDYAKSLVDASKTMAGLNVAAEKLKQQRSDWQVEDAKLQAKIDLLKKQGASTKAIASIEQQRYNKQIEFTKEELRIAQERQKIRGDNSETDNINSLSAELVELRSKRDTSSITNNKGVNKNIDDSLKKQQEYQNASTKSQIEFEQTQIELLDNSFYKQQKQIELNHKKALADVDQQAAEMLQKKKEAYGDNAILSDAEKEQLQKQTAAADKEYSASMKQLSDSINNEFKEGRLRFADELTVQLADIDNYYTEKIKKAKGNEDLIAMYKINKEKEIALARNAYSKKMLQNDLEVTKKRIENAKNYYKTEADRREAELKAEKAAKEKELELLERQYAINQTAELAAKIAQARLELEQFNKELSEVPKQRISELSGEFSKIIGSLGGLDGEIGQVFSSLSGSMKSVSDSFSADTSTMEGQAGAISTAISNVVNIINVCIAATKARKKAEEEFYTNAIAFAHEYALALNETVLTKSSSNAFIADYASELKDGYTAITDAQAKYQEAISKLSEGKAKISLRDSVDWNATLKTTAYGAAAGAAVGSVIPVIGTAIGAVVGAVGGFFVGLFGSKKKAAETAGLLDVFPELVDSAGNLNTELAQTLIDTDQVDDITKQLLQNALDWADAVEAAREQISTIVQDLAGDVGNDLRTAIVDAWKAGEDASSAMFKTAGNSLEDFVTQLLYSTIFSDVFDEFSDKLADSLDPLNGDQDVVDDFDWLMAQMNSKDDTYLALLDSIKKRAQAAGFTSFGEEDDDSSSSSLRTALSSSSITASQDSVDVLSGTMTAQLIAAENTSLKVGGINDSLIAGLLIWAEIRDNTAYCKHLEEIDKNIKSMKEEVDTINMQGLKIK